MALDLDGMTVLRDLGSHPDAFPDLVKEAGKIARGLIVKQLKAKSLVVATYQAMGRAIGAESLTLVVEGLTESEVKTLLGRLDKHTALADASPAQRRQHLAALAAGTVAPAAPPSKAKAARRPAKKKAEPLQRLSSAAFDAERKR